MNSHASLVSLSSTRDRLKLVSFTGGISPVFLLDARTSEIDLNGTAQLLRNMKLIPGDGEGGVKPKSPSQAQRSLSCMRSFIFRLFKGGGVTF